MEREKHTFGFGMNVTSGLRSHWGRRLRNCPTWNVIAGEDLQWGKFSLPHQWRSAPSLCRISSEVSQSFPRKCWSELSDLCHRLELLEIFHIAGKVQPRNIKFLKTIDLNWLGKDSKQSRHWHAKRSKVHKLLHHSMKSNWWKDRLFQKCKYLNLNIPAVICQ